MNDKFEKARKVLAHDMREYVQLILKEHTNDIHQERQEYLRAIDDYYSRIVVTDNGTISMFATNREIIMPSLAYKIFKYMKFIPGYGINKKHKSYKEGEIVNNNTYFDYIKHVFISGMDVEQFFRDTLLHETMHFCGSDGGSAMREGLTELKTRELAQKYNLQASRCGYPKEVEIASQFQQIIGQDTTNQITFAQDDTEIYRILQERCGKNVADLYIEIARQMDDELNAKYDHSKFWGLFGPIKKARAYFQIDYSQIQKRLEDFRQEERQSKDSNENFINTLQLQKENEVVKQGNTQCQEKKKVKEDEEFVY